MAHYRELDDPARVAVDAHLLTCADCRLALAAYAAAGMAGSDPFKTGNTAFRLGIAKALVPGSRMS